MELKLYIKQANSFNGKGQPIVFIGANPQTLTPVINGTLPSNRQWRGYGNYIDVTNDASDLTKLKITWTTERDEKGEVSFLTERKKSATGQITLEGEAYRLIKSWLVDDVSAPLNAVSVKIEDVGCGMYEDFQIKGQDITFCESDPNLCTFTVTLKQVDKNLTCIKNTLIADNHQGWFQNDTFKQHPRFSYCNEQRPNGLMVAIWVALTLIFCLVQIVVIPILLFLTVLFGILNAIISAINAVINAFSFLGLNPIDPLPKPPSVGDFFRTIGDMYLETAGCGREHPSPLIRDYIKNVCDKCGLEVDAITASVFFSPTLQINTSSRGVVNGFNPHFNACYYYAPVKRGIRRAKGLLGLSANTNNDHYIVENQPILTLDKFLDELKTLYNAEWRIVNNKLYIQRKDYYVNGGAYLYDFSLTAPDRLKLLEGICFEWNEVKQPASVVGIYGEDPQDKCGNEARTFMNDIYSYGNSILNPTFDGLDDKRTQYGATNFRLMGVSEDYILDAFQQVLSFVTGTVILMPFFISIRDAIYNALTEFADYALLIQGETTQLPKILLWDGTRTKNARAVKPYAVFLTPNLSVPPPNTKYNATPFFFNKTVDTDVRGVSAAQSSSGYYTVFGYFGLYQRRWAAMLVNYWMYTGMGFQDTMWDWFHWIDDPIKNPKQNLSFTLKIELCCEDLKHIAVFGNGDAVRLGDKVKLPANFYTDGTISEIEVSYDTEGETGQYIQIKGKA